MRQVKNAQKSTKPLSRVFSLAIALITLCGVFSGLICNASSALESPIEAIYSYSTAPYQSITFNSADAVSNGEAFESGYLINKQFELPYTRLEQYSISEKTDIPLNDFSQTLKSEYVETFVSTDKVMMAQALTLFQSLNEVWNYQLDYSENNNNADLCTPDYWNTYNIMTAGNMRLFFSFDNISFTETSCISFLLDTSREYLVLKFLADYSNILAVYTSQDTRNLFIKVVYDESFPDWDSAMNSANDRYGQTYVNFFNAFKSGCKQLETGENEVKRYLEDTLSWHNNANSINPNDNYVYQFYETPIPNGLLNRHHNRATGLTSNSLQFTLFGNQSLYSYYDHDNRSSIVIRGRYGEVECVTKGRITVGIKHVDQESGRFEVEFKSIDFEYTQHKAPSSSDGELNDVTLFLTPAFMSLPETKDYFTQSIRMLSIDYIQTKVNIKDINMDVGNPTIVWNLAYDRTSETTKQWISENFGDTTIEYTFSRPEIPEGSFLKWLADAVSSFLDAEIFFEVSIGEFLWFVLGIVVLFAVFRYFKG